MSKHLPPVPESDPHDGNSASATPETTVLNRDKQPTVPVYLYPDTGHHFTFIPFEDSFLSRFDSGRQLRAACLTERVSWQEYEDSDKKVYKWIRWRLGTQGQKLGVWVAIETNIGSIKRGRLLAEKTVSEQEAPATSEQRVATPYAYSSWAQLGGLLDAEGHPMDHLPVEFKLNVNPDARHEYVAIAKLELVWKTTENSFDVDLIVDFGNTRTMVLALENEPDWHDGRELSSFCRPIRFLARGEEYYRGKNISDTNKVIADSWFLLQESIFAEWNYPVGTGRSRFNKSLEYQPIQEERGRQLIDFLPLRVGGARVTQYRLVERVPQMFVDISPIIMGDEAKSLLSNVNLSEGLNLSLSSPKRYLWDDGTLAGSRDWHINPNRWSPKNRRDRPHSLAGPICTYMYSDARDWDISTPPYADPDTIKRPTWVPNTPNYTRDQAMVWSALSILETAYRQITSSKWNEGNHPNYRRRLRSIVVTYPSGWIAREVEAYRKAWNRARDIFTLAHMVNKESTMQYSNGCKPEVHMELDEAVASQLPFIYSEISRLSDGNQWISLYGGGRSKKLSENTVRVMTVDIGGGTTDTSIVEYRNIIAGGVSLRYNVLFRDCSSAAGDMVVLAIIQRVLLPSILVTHGALVRDKDGYSVPNPNAHEVCRAFASVLSTSHGTQSEHATWQRITKLFFVPIVRQWLSDLVDCPKGYYSDDVNGDYRSIGSIEGANMVDAAALEDFNKQLHAELGHYSFRIDTDAKLEYDPERLRSCIYDELLKAIEPLATFVAAYEVDLITLSGKISEMPRVHDMLKEKLPILPQRIIRMKDYYAGSWYPMNAGGRIADAKSVTVIGAAIYLASQNGNMAWSLSRDEHIATPVKNYWGPINSLGNSNGGFAGGVVILEPDETSNEHKRFTSVDNKEYVGTQLGINAFIGRQKYNAVGSRPEQQYKLVWKGDPRRAPRAPLAVVISRVDGSESVGAGDDDDIELVSVTGTAGEDVNTADVALVLNTLSPDGFWMDRCLYHVDYSNEKYN